MKNRVGIVVSDSILLTFLGLVYAWSVFKKPLALAYSWDDSQLTWTFTICMFMFCLGGFAGAQISKKIAHKILTWICGGLIGLSFILMGFMTSLWQIYVLYGVIIGFTVGVVYNCVLSTGNKWFPDKGGLIAGLLLMFFGAGSLFLSPLSNALMAGLGLQKAFLIIGLMFIVVFLLGGFQVKFPKNDELPEIKADNKKKVSTLDVTPKEMLETKNFWLYFIWCALVSAIGIGLVGQVATISGFVGMKDTTAALMVSLFAVFNGLGRFFFGSFYDKRGRLLTMSIFCVMFIVGGAILFLGVKLTQTILVIIAFIFLGAAYGGVTPTNANFARSFFGQKNYATNYSLVNFNLLVSVFLGQFIGSTLFMKTGSFEATAIAIVIIGVISLTIQLFIRQPKIA